MNKRTERRNNWKEAISHQAGARRQKQNELLIELRGINAELKKVGRNIEKYDDLKAQQRDIIAKLAAL